MVSTIIVIPARGGSVEVPRKNLRLLNGKPLILYTILAAKGTSFKKDIFVSSDDNEILNLSEYYQCKTLKRSKALSDHKTTLDEVIYDTFLKAEAIENKKYQHIITLQPTSPLIKSKDINLAFKKLCDSKSDTVISVSRENHLFWKVNKKR